MVTFVFYKLMFTINQPCSTTKTTCVKICILYNQPTLFLSYCNSCYLLLVVVVTIQRRCFSSSWWSFFTSDYWFGLFCDVFSNYERTSMTGYRTTDRLLTEIPTWQSTIVQHHQPPKLNQSPNLKLWRKMSDTSVLQDSCFFFSLFLLFLFWIVGIWK